MDGKEDSQRETVRAGAPGMVLVGLAVLLALLGAACHGFADPRHRSSVHSLEEFEYYCYETWDSSIVDDEDAEDYIYDAIYPEGAHADEAWTAIYSYPSPHNAIIFYPFGPCPNPHPPEDEQTWITYMFKADGQMPAYCGGANCVGHYNQECHEVNDDEEHCHYTHQHVNLKDSSIGSSIEVRRHTINHETGHVLGLLDPGGTGEFEGCTAEIRHTGMVLWIDSIMHAPPSYCSAYAPEEVYEWPRPGDHTGVSYVMEYEQVADKWQCCP